MLKRMFKCLLIQCLKGKLRRDYNIIAHKIGKPFWKSFESTIPIRYDDPLYESHFAKRRFILIFVYFRGNYRRLVVTTSYRLGGLLRLDDEIGFGL